MDPLKKIDIVEYRDGAFFAGSDNVTSEKRLRIFSNDKEVLSLLCTPTMVRELVVGFALSEGLVESSGQKDMQQPWCAERIEILWKQEEIEVRLPVDLPKASVALTSGCAKGITFISDVSEGRVPAIEDNINVGVSTIIERYAEFQKRSELFRMTGGVHSAALCDKAGIIVFADDIGRHNAVDKIIGHAFLENIGLKGKILLLSGRLSSEITIKTIKAGIPVLVSRAAPTDLSVDIAKTHDLTLIGFLRGRRLNVYSGAERLKN